MSDPISMNQGYEAALLATVLTNGLDKYYEFIRFPDAFSDDFKKTIKDFEDYYKEYGDLPSFAICKNVWGLSLPEEHSEDSPEFFMNLIEQTHLHAKVKTSIQEIATLARSEPEKAINEGLSQLLDLQAQISKTNADYFLAHDYSAHEDYLRDIVLENPTPTMLAIFDSMTSGGFRGGELVTYAARPSHGKTWVLILNAIRAWQMGKRVVFITTEMSVAEIRTRFLCLALGLEIDLISTSVLTVHREIHKRAEKVWKEQGIYDNLMILNEDGNAVEDLEVKLLAFKPDMVFIDGFYLLQTRQKEKEKHIRIGNIVNRLKRFARRQNCVVCVSTQLNRDVTGDKKKSAKDLGRLAFSDDIGMISDYVVFLSRDKHETLANVMKFEIPKGRRLRENNDLFIDFNLMAPRESFHLITERVYEERIKKVQAEEQERKNAGGDFNRTSTQGTDFKQPAIDYKKYI